MSLLLLAACAPGLDLQLELSSVPTVVRAQWTSAGGPDRLAWSIDGETWTDVVAPAGADGACDALAIGLKPETEYRFRVTSGDAESAVHVLTTGDPPDLPDATVTWGGQDVEDGLLAVGVISTTSRAVIFDRDGEAVWWASAPRDLIVTRVRPAIDGQSVLYNAFDPGNEDLEGHLFRVGWDGAPIEDFSTGGMHHDWAQAPDGTIAWLDHHRREEDGQLFYVDVLVERAPDGTTRDLWSALDHYDPADYLDVSAGTSFVHANVVVHDPVEDDWWIGLRNASQIVRVDRETGAQVERLFGDDGDYAIVGTAPAWQHGFVFTDDGILVHDNREDDSQTTRAVEYRLDRDAGRLEEVWQHSSGLHVLGLGDVVRMADGDTLGVWGMSGAATELTPAGEEAWRLDLAVGAAFGYASWIPLAP